ncbi:hypothetical protein OEA41_006224 [Lepraria neglecta]|uniref:Cytochrome P450 n=1 Tax=Lepraria neglecta TaxID=209136 RepID=A0AAD9ZB68_9LECA|nr:hypothetical protein OEA41_006224 [Lepraria neglecta]
MEQFTSNSTAPEGHIDPTLHTSYDSLNDPDQISRASKWIYFLAVPTVTIVLWLLWAFVLRLYLLRQYYEKQGIRFVKNCYTVLGLEMRVPMLQGKNKSYDWLYTERPTDLFGTVRGFSVQLYGPSAEFCEELIAKTGKDVDRNTPALFLFGRLSLYALTFLPITKWRLRERKVTLTRVEEALAGFKVKNGSGATINIRELLNHWTREFIWGKNNVNRYLEVLNYDGQLKSLPFMTALNQTFTDLRFYASCFWNRVCFPLAALPLTKESRRLEYNIRLLRKATEDKMTTPEEGAVAANVQEANDALGIPIGMTRDDLVTATIAGLDTTKSTVMGTLFHLLKPENSTWRQQILAEINELKAESGDIYYDVSSTPGDLILEDYDRVAPENTGPAKVGGNDSQLVPHIEKASASDYGILLHLDSNTPTEIDEFSMSGFVGIKMGGDGDSSYTVVVPYPKRVIESVTSDSVCEIARDLGWRTSP